MITAEFYHENGQPAGFRFMGHSDASEAGTDIVCAAVSSAAYLAANTITEIIGVPADILVEDGIMSFKIPLGRAPECGAVLKGLRLHLAGLQEQYPTNIQITDTEV